MGNLKEKKCSRAPEAYKFANQYAYIIIDYSVEFVKAIPPPPDTRKMVGKT